MNYTCGIDWASEHHDVSIVNRLGMEVKGFRIEDDLNGYRELLKVLRSFGDDIPIAIECKEHLVISFLINEGYKIYAINPKSSNRYKDRFKVSGTKTDEIDAFSLANILRTDIHNHRPLAYSSKNIQKLQILCGEYEKLLKDKNLLENQLFDVVSKYYPLVLTLFEKNSCKILYRLIQYYPTYKKLKETSYEELKVFLKKSHYLNPKHSERLYRRIQESEYYENNIFDEIFSHTAKALSRLLLILTEELEGIKKEMVLITKNHELGKVFYSLPGSGDVMSAKLLAVMGDNKELYRSSAEVQAYTGIAPIVKRSGKSFRVIFRKACNRAYRDTLTWFAFCSMPYCSWARKYYDRKREEGKRHYESLRFLAFKWLRIIYELWKSGELYNEALYLKNLKRFEEKKLKIA